MGPYAMRGYRSSRRTFFRGFDPRHAYGLRGGFRRGGMGGVLKVAFLGTFTYLIAKQFSRTNQCPPAGFNGPAQPVSQHAQYPPGTRYQYPVQQASNPSSGGPASPE
ncbi:hypothetical protein N7471_003032 [Penicillium samsonianum]|uniref:uncharacterized protein n=1 Tax=Penicillium samsonianum TaxID=1882272 RepID=UPI0025494EF3|nr:uncharacterized protein N7471_003032 [Penicillium samsonianum]KAJ6143579.1 hypothetical protein N7471_003032 [Penicillium samsonianum]